MEAVRHFVTSYLPGLSLSVTEELVSTLAEGSCM